MQVANGHKGKAGYVCSVIGLEAHSALNHLGVNAIEFAAELVSELRRMNLAFRARGPFVEGFDPPHCTVSTGTISGGSALNIVPNHCRLEFEFRTVPGQSPGELIEQVRAWAEARLLPEMRAVFPGAGIEWQELMSYPGLGGSARSEVEGLACEVTGTVVPGKLAFGTEAGHFEAHGIPAIVCGPGDIAVAHKPDESVSLDQLRRCRDFLRQLVRQLVVA